MKKAKILLCVCGGIAAYKAIDLASMLYKQGFEIRTVLTESACKFVSPLNFAAITHHDTHSSLWDDNDPIPHIYLADWADLVVVAPASANTIAKAAHGIADNLLSSLLLAHSKPVLWVPAMNVHMYENQATIDNIKVLQKRGHHILDPAFGLLACAYTGQGKYPPNIEIVYAIRSYLEYGQDLRGVKVLLTAGATIEAIDPMRVISNKSSGKMSLALARALFLRGAEVILIYGSISEALPYYLSEAIQTLSVNQMHETVLSHAMDCNWIIKCAAVSDYKPAAYSESKIKKGEDLHLDLIQTKDILTDLGQMKQENQLLIGFAAETDNMENNAKEKLAKKNLDLIIANDLKYAGSDDNEITMIDRELNMTHAQGDKFELAHRVIDRIKDLCVQS